MIVLYVVCIFVRARAGGDLLVAATGGSWTNVYTAMLDGSIRNPGRWGLTLGVSAPILLVALGTIVNGRAGLVNIGQEGQLVIGSCFAAYRRRSARPVPGRSSWSSSMLVGIVGGAHLGRHRRRAALLAQRARGADHTADRQPSPPT